MDTNTALSFCYARASGLLGKSFIQDKVQNLFNVKTLEELWSLLFNEPCPLIPQSLLASKIEKKAFFTLLKTYSSFLEKFDNPSRILRSQIKDIESENLKLIIDSLAHHQKKLPKMIDLGMFSKVHPEYYPNLPKITHDSQYKFLHNIPKVKDIQKTDFMIDLEMIQGLWSSINTMPKSEREICKKLFIESYSVKNIIWAMRLNVYYQKSKEEIISELFYVTDCPSLQDPIASGAIKILDYDINDFSTWKNFKYIKQLNQPEDSTWKLDPAYFEVRHNVESEKKYLQIFHQYPMTQISLIAWFKIKLYELNCIRSAVEALRLNIEPKQALATLGVM